jgi:putrescine transport system substrate-binding protein
VDSWDLVFKEENISKLKQCGVAMLDSPTEIVSIALHYLGLPHNSHNPQDYEKAQALLLSIRPYVRYFDSSRLAQDLANGNTCMIVGWAGDVTEAQDAIERAGNGRQLAYSIPREGTLMWSENLVLLNDAPHPIQGLEFINYLLRSEIITKTTNHTGYPSGSINAKFHFDEKRRDNSGINPSPETIATLFPLEPLPLNLERLRTRVWSKVKSGI